MRPAELHPVEVPLPGFTGKARPGKRGYPATGWQREGQGPRVVALGDSVTFGVGDLPGINGDVGWGAHLAEALGASYYLNLSRMGARARTVSKEQLQRALDVRPDVAVIVVGGNDVLRADFSPREVRDQMMHIISTLRSAGAEVVVMRLHDPRKTLPLPAFIRNALGARIDRVNNALDAAVAATAELQPIYIDAGADKAAYEQVTWHIDRMHPSPWGHRWLARLALEALVARGHPQRSPMPGVEAELPSRRDTIIWLITKGTPWLLRRSIDLIPGTAILILIEIVFRRAHPDLVQEVRERNGGVA